MANSYRLEGAGYFYTFPETFDLVSIDHDQNLPLREIPGVDGASVDRRVARHETTRHVLNGFIDAASMTAAKTEFDKMNAALLRARIGDAFLVDLTSLRRIPVSVVSVRGPRRPSAILEVSIVFQSFSAFWEDVNTTHATVTGQRLDLNIGDAPTRNLESHVTGSFANPTLVLGNWAYCLNLPYTIATAINTVSAKRPYGTIVDSTGNTPTVVSTSDGLGRLIKTDELFHALCVLRSEVMTFSVRFAARGTWPTTSHTYLLGLANLAQTVGMNLKIKSGSNSVQLETQAGTRIMAGNLGTRVYDKLYNITGWLDSAGTLIDGANPTLYGQLFVNGTQVKSLQTAQTFSTATLTRVRVGGTTTGGGRCDQAMTAVYIAHQNLGPDWCQAEGRSKRRLSADNRVFKWAETLSADQQLVAKHGEGLVYERITSDGALSLRMAPFDGDFFILGDSNMTSRVNKEHVYASASFTQSYIYKRQYYA